LKRAAAKDLNYCGWTISVFSSNGSFTLNREPAPGREQRAEFVNPREADGKAALRVALYSHDTMGIGHMRRNLLIAQTLARGARRTTTLLIAGAREASAFSMSAGVDCLTLPALQKELSGDYRARCLDVSLQKLRMLRARTIQAALEAFDPDVLIVDKVPRGAGGELDLALEDLSCRGRTRCVLGLRDILDDPAAVRSEWQEAGSEETVRRFYDAIWIYGDPAVYDLVQECDFSCDVAAKLRYTGYLDQRERLRHATGVNAEPPASLDLPEGRLVVCSVGGGQDGALLAEVFSLAELPPDTNAVLISGPFMPPEVHGRLRQRAAGRPRFRVLEFITEPERLLERADCVVAMGGYNTVCEILSFEKRALIVPRVRPRREQLIRAERLCELGLIDMLHPDHLHPQALSRWLAGGVVPRRSARQCLDLNGLLRLPRLMDELLFDAPRRELSSPPVQRNLLEVH
jgi:predicted glycosyltransferase